MANETTRHPAGRTEEGSSLGILGSLAGAAALWVHEQFAPAPWATELAAAASGVVMLVGGLVLQLLRDRIGAPLLMAAGLQKTPHAGAQLADEPDPGEGPPG